MRAALLAAVLLLLVPAASKVNSHPLDPLTSTPARSRFLDHG